MSTLQTVLLALRDRPGVRGAVVVSDEGLPVAGALPDGVDAEAAAAHAATVWRGVATLGEVTGTGAPEELVVEAPQGVAIVRRLGPGTTLLILADGAPELLGDLLHDLRRHAPALLAST